MDLLEELKARDERIEKLERALSISAESKRREPSRQIRQELF